MIPPKKNNTQKFADVLTVLRAEKPKWTEWERQAWLWQRWREMRQFQRNVLAGEETVKELRKLLVGIK